MRLLLIVGLLLSMPVMAQVKPVQVKPVQILPAKVPAKVNLQLPYEARLGSPKFSGSFEAGGARWTCGSGLCRASASWPEPTVAACEALASRAGTIVSFGQGKRTLAAKSLAQCNRGVRVAADSGSKAKLAMPAGALTAASIAPRVADRRAEHARLVNLRVQAQGVAARIQGGQGEKHGQGRDCDDSRRDVHPLAAEVCDMVDNNCDGFVDEGQTFRLFLDGDGDGHGDPARPADVCPAQQQAAAAEGRWLVPVGNDCDDEDPARWQECA